jgi:hypothetical protein
MTSNNASSQRKPAAVPCRRRQVDQTLIRSIPRSRPPISSTSADMHPRDRTLRHASPRSLYRPTRRAPRSSPTPTRPPALGIHQIPIDPKVASGPAGSLYGAVAVKHLFTAGTTSFRVSWFDPGSPFLRPDPQVWNGGARRGRQDRPSLKPFPKLRCGQAASLRPRARWHAGGGRDDALEGSSPLAARRTSHHNLVFGGPRETRTMMQPCASVAKLRNGGPILPFGIAAIEHPPDARHLEPSSATYFHSRRIYDLRISCS